MTGSYIRRTKSYEAIEGGVKPFDKSEAMADDSDPRDITDIQPPTADEVLADRGFYAGGFGFEDLGVEHDLSDRAVLAALDELAKYAVVASQDDSLVLV
jgi:hypothetical protein